MTSRDNAYETVEYQGEPVVRGNGGETRQRAADGRPRLTTKQGVVVSDDQNTLRVGERGPAPTPTSTGATCGPPSSRARSRSGSSACSCSTRSSPTGSLRQATGVDRLMDRGFIEIGNGSADPSGLLSQCRQLRYWERETSAA
jgi:hypothetical protein